MRSMIIGRFMMCFILLFFKESACAGGPDIIFLLIGQSNMAGRAPMIAEDSKPIEGVVLLNGHGSWEPATHPLNRYAANRRNINWQKYGLGASFSMTIRDRLPPQTIGLIVNARGGTSIGAWKRGKPVYQDMLERLRDAGISQIAGILWHQGESNARDPLYLEKLQVLVESLRQDLGQPQLLFIAGEIYGDWPVNESINGLPVVTQGTAVVSADALTTFDGLHFDRQSYDKLGKRYAKAWLTAAGHEGF